MNASCLFCAIVKGEKSAHVVFDDEVAVGFLDIKPVFHGHVLVVPKPHVPTLLDLPASDIGPFFERVQRIARAVPIACEAEGTFVATNNVVSQSVPHLHVHVVPRKKKDGLKGFFWPRTKYASDDEMEAVAEKIRRRLAE